MRDTLFHAEVVLFGTAPPCLQFGEAEDRADDKDQDGPLAATTGWGLIGGLRFS